MAHKLTSKLAYNFRPKFDFYVGVWYNDNRAERLGLLDRLRAVVLSVSFSDYCYEFGLLVNLPIGL
nr:MAG TPA: hypothetical protein [Caudoviricetes sp.]